MRARIQKISRYAPSIFQGRLDFSGRNRRFSLAVELPAERAVFRILLAAFAMFACAYIYLVGSTVLNVIARKEALAQTASLASAVSELESQYFAASRSLGPEDGTRLGLSPVGNTMYVHRPGNTAAAKISGDEI